MSINQHKESNEKLLKPKTTEKHPYHASREIIEFTIEQLLGFSDF